ncbi:uncharacterized protein KD926_010210 [Aspergillus affinis]|uniref:uncharacterized protein n=1 Tax=Aspergillus affinis TaxID=1070780 RepID=UPI0022FE0008|nr:uncharacterized protein KD926_010210 [Aspergillus affinis]KAI9038877.1 hypothetical protein KD926_010210 [Aspergillus affinis]
MGYNGSAELFAEWAIGLVVVAVRVYARWSVDVYGSNIGLTEKTAMEVPDEEVAILRKGSIYAFVAWLSYIFMVWSFKGVLMFLYGRLTMGLWQHRLAQAVGVLCICTFLASLFFHLFICHPVQKTWQIKPYAGDNCTIRPLNYIVIETLSIVTDLGVMSIPIPLVLAARIPTPQKIFLSVLFSSGVFVMVAAFLRAYYSVKDITTLSTALGWASREALVSVIIVCAPGIKPLCTKWGWFRSYGSSGSYEYNYGYGHSQGQNRSQGNGDRSRARSTVFGGKRGSGAFGTERYPYEMGGSAVKKKRDSSGESQERIVAPGLGIQGKGSDDDINRIVVTTDVTFAHEDLHTRQT